MFQGSKILTDEGTTDVQVLIDYIQRDLGGVIGEGYLDQNGAGRITITQASGPLATPRAAQAATRVPVTAPIAQTAAMRAMTKTAPSPPQGIAPPS